MIKFISLSDERQERKKKKKKSGITWKSYG